jgi:antitoxin MazE
MKISKWGNSLAIRIPVEVAEQAGLKDGDEATVSLTSDNVIQIRSGEQRRREAIEAIRRMRVKLPEGYVFRRSDIYDE